MKKIGIIGLGSRMNDIIRNEFKYFPELSVVAIADINLNLTKERIENLASLDGEKIRLYEDGVEMLDSEELDGVFVATRCDLHKKFAIEVLKRNIPLFWKSRLYRILKITTNLKRAWKKVQQGESRRSLCVLQLF